MSFSVRLPRRGQLLTRTCLFLLCANNAEDTSRVSHFKFAMFRSLPRDRIHWYRDSRKTVAPGRNKLELLRRIFFLFRCVSVPWPAERDRFCSGQILVCRTTTWQGICVRYHWILRKIETSGILVFPLGAVVSRRYLEVLVWRYLDA